MMFLSLIASSICVILEKEPRILHFADDVDSQFLARRLLYKATQNSVLYCTRVAECQIIYT